MGVPLAFAFDWGRLLKIADPALRLQAGPALALTVAAFAVGLPFNALPRLAMAVQRGWLQAAWIALALPRILLRRPYGAKTEPIDSFAFEEIPGAPEHEAYVWGNGALACALVLTALLNRRGGISNPRRRPRSRACPPTSSRRASRRASLRRPKSS